MFHILVNNKQAIMDGIKITTMIHTQKKDRLCNLEKMSRI